LAFVSPSARLNTTHPSRIARAKTFFERLGYHVKIIFNPLPSSFPDAVLQRCEEIHTAFRDPAIKAIVCTIGGLSANELLPHLDYSLIRAHPKIFVGYSDITLLHHALFTHANLCTFYGPAILPQFGDPQHFDFTTAHFLHVLQQSVHTPIGPIPRSPVWTEDHRDWEISGTDTSEQERTVTASPPWKWLRHGTATGRLFGGCLPSICQVVGTPYAVDYRDRILLLETPEGETGGAFPVEQARSCLADLVNAGILRAVAGIVCGRGFRYDEVMREEFEQVLLDQCWGMEGVPILANVDSGHTDPMVTLPLDGLVRLDSRRDEFVVLESAVAAREG